jgi:hypothetical protein
MILFLLAFSANSGPLRLEASLNLIIDREDEEGLAVIFFFLIAGVEMVDEGKDFSHYLVD